MAKPKIIDIRHLTIVYFYAGYEIEQEDNSGEFWQPADAVMDYAMDFNIIPSKKYETTQFCVNRCLSRLADDKIFCRRLEKGSNPPTFEYRVNADSDDAMRLIGKYLKQKRPTDEIYKNKPIKENVKELLRTVRFDAPEDGEEWMKVKEIVDLLITTQAIDPNKRFTQGNSVKYYLKVLEKEGFVERRKNYYRFDFGE